MLLEDELEENTPMGHQELFHSVCETQEDLQRDVSDISEPVIDIANIEAPSTEETELRNPILEGRSETEALEQIEQTNTECESEDNVHDASVKERNPEDMDTKVEEKEETVSRESNECDMKCANVVPKDPSEEEMLLDKKPSHSFSRFGDSVTCTCTSNVMHEQNMGEKAIEAALSEPQNEMESDSTKATLDNLETANESSAPQETSNESVINNEVGIEDVSEDTSEAIAEIVAEDVVEEKDAAVADRSKALKINIRQKPMVLEEPKEIAASPNPSKPDDEGRPMHVLIIHLHCFHQSCKRRTVFFLSNILNM